MIAFPVLGRLGNLGNQLFQVASVTGIAAKVGTQASFPKWNYEQYFKNPLPHAGVTKPADISEKHFYFDESLVNLDPSKDYNLFGYLQSEQYWNKETTLKIFEFADTFKQELANKYKHVLSKKHVAITVRRGDFVNNPNYFQIPITYYLNAYYKHFGAEYNVILFSDDFAWCKTHFRALPNVTFAQELNAIEQLCLMSMCDNFIISNSTFSWWGAYLSQSKNVYRPEKNFAGDLAKQNSEKDYWPGEWKVFKDYRIDLTDTTFIIPVLYDHLDRKLNLMLTLNFLLENFNTNIIIGEQGGSEFKSFEDYATYVQFDMPVFHRTKMINDMAKMAKTPIIVNWDCDNICAPAQVSEAVNKIRQGVDVSYPFDGTVQRAPRFCFQEVSDTLDVFSISEKYCVKKHSSVGHAVVMNKKSFIKAGMENENFVSWGPEDSERYNRYNILGLNVQRVPGPMYHMDHHIGENSSTNNKFFKDNEKEFMNVATRNKTQLEQYIMSWEWACDYTKGGIVPSKVTIVDKETVAGFVPIEKFNKLTE